MTGPCRQQIGSFAGPFLFHHHNRMDPSKSAAVSSLPFYQCVSWGMYLPLGLLWCAASFFLLRSVRSAVVPLARVSALYRWLPFYRGTPMEKKKNIYIYVDNRSSYLRLGRLFLFLFFFTVIDYIVYCVCSSYMIITEI